MSDEPHTRGRPPKPQAERRRHNQTFRCADALLERLRAAAQHNQRSVSEEVERRLEQSFEREDMRQAVREEIRAALGMRDSD